MQLRINLSRSLICALCCLVTSACSFNPFITNNHTTGSPGATAAGAGLSAGVIWLAGGSKTWMLIGGIAGGAAGYYLSSLRYDASGIFDAGGNVYVLGDYMGIYIPSDKLFEVNTAELLPRSNRILDSVVAVLERKPNNNIIISGNTSGFDRPRREQKLSQKRAKVVAAYLWSSGLEQFKDRSSDTRQFNYVGYGDLFPIASNRTNKGIRENSRIQITSYPSHGQLYDRGHKIDMDNVAGMDQREPEPGDGCGREGRC